MSAHRLSGVRVLLVDDEPDSLEVARVMLASEGAIVASANNADDALQMIGEQPPDAVLCDISMPTHDGFWLLRKMRANGARGTPVAALTAHASAATRAEVLAAGFSLHVTKPADCETLVEAVRTMLGTRSQN